MKNIYGKINYDFEREIQAYCPLGKDYYTCKIRVFFEANEEIFDFCVIDDYIKSLGGSRMIIEELVTAVYDRLSEYKPLSLTVNGEAKSNIHFPVTVSKFSPLPF